MGVEVGSAWRHTIVVLEGGCGARGMWSCD